MFPLTLSVQQSGHPKRLCNFKGLLEVLPVTLPWHHLHVNKVWPGNYKVKKKTPKENVTAAHAISVYRAAAWTSAMVLWINRMCQKTTLMTYCSILMHLKANLTIQSRLQTGTVLELFRFSSWPVFVQQSVEHASVAPGRGEVDAAEAGVAFCRLLAP